MPRRRDRTTGPQLVDVSIEDADDGATADDGLPRGGVLGGLSRRLSPVGRWALLGLSAVAAVVVLTTVWATGNADERRKDDALRAALADVPGVLDPLDEPLRILWTAQVGGTPIAHTDDVVVLSTVDDAALALDASSGDVLWRRERGLDESCEAFAAPAGRDARASRVICWVSTDIVQAEGPLGLPPSEVVVLDVATGTEVDAYEVPGTLIAVERLDDSALIASADDAGTVEVQRWAPRAGLSWSFAEPGLLTQIQDEGLLFRAVGPQFWIGGLDAVGRSVATGEPIPDGGPAPELYSTGAVRLADGGWASWVTHDPPGLRGPRFLTRVTDDDGSLRFEIAGLPWVDDGGGATAFGATPIVTDGRPSDLLLMRLDAGMGDAGRVAGVDARTGAVRWEGQRLAGVAPCVRVGGVLVAAGTGRVLALDVASGRELWSSAAGERAGGVSITDGERLVLPTEVGDGPALTSFDIETGATGWTVVLADEPVSLTALGGRQVLMVTAGGARGDEYTVSVLG